METKGSRAGGDREERRARRDRAKRAAIRRQVKSKSGPASSGGKSATNPKTNSRKKRLKTDRNEATSGSSEAPRKRAKLETKRTSDSKEDSKMNKKKVNSSPVVRKSNVTPTSNKKVAQAKKQLKQMQNLGFFEAPPRRTASLNAAAMVQCMYGSESGSAAKTKSKTGKSPVTSPSIRKEPSSSSHEKKKPSDLSRSAGENLDEDNIKNRKNVHVKKSKIKSFLKADQKKPMKTRKKMMQKKKKSLKDEYKMDIKDMIVTKRIASLNASAIMSASYSKQQKKLDDHEPVLEKKKIESKPESPDANLSAFAKGKDSLEKQVEVQEQRKSSPDVKGSSSVKQEPTKDPSHIVVEIEDEAIKSQLIASAMEKTKKTTEFKKRAQESKKLKKPKPLKEVFPSKQKEIGDASTLDNPLCKMDDIHKNVKNLSKSDRRVSNVSKVKPDQNRADIQVVKSQGLVQPGVFQFVHQYERIHTTTAVVTQSEKQQKSSKKSTCTTLNAIATFQAENSSSKTQESSRLNFQNIQSAVFPQPGPSNAKLPKLSVTGHHAPPTATVQPTIVSAQTSKASVHNAPGPLVETVQTEPKNFMFDNNVGLTTSEPSVVSGLPFAFPNPFTHRPGFPSFQSPLPHHPLNVYQHFSFGMRDNGHTDVRPQALPVPNAYNPPGTYFLTPLQSMNLASLPMITQAPIANSVAGQKSNNSFFSTPPVNYVTNGFLAPILTQGQNLQCFSSINGVSTPEMSAFTYSAQHNMATLNKPMPPLISGGNSYGLPGSDVDVGASKNFSRNNEAASQHSIEKETHYRGGFLKKEAYVEQGASQIGHSKTNVSSKLGKELPAHSFVVGQTTIHPINPQDNVANHPPNIPKSITTITPITTPSKDVARPSQESKSASTKTSLKVLREYRRPKSKTSLAETGAKGSNNHSRGSSAIVNKFQSENSKCQILSDARMPKIPVYSDLIARQSFTNSSQHSSNSKSDEGFNTNGLLKLAKAAQDDIQRTMVHQSVNIFPVNSKVNTINSNKIAPHTSKLNQSSEERSKKSLLNATKNSSRNGASYTILNLASAAKSLNQSFQKSYKTEARKGSHGAQETRRSSSACSIMKFDTFHAQLSGSSSRSCSTSPREKSNGNKSIVKSSKSNSPKLWLAEPKPTVVRSKPNVPLVPFVKRNNGVPKVCNGWTWIGEGSEQKVYLNNKDSPVYRICYESMRHVEGDVVKIRDCIVLASSNRKKDLPYIAKVASLWENPSDGEMMMSLLWYYRPEHLDENGRRYDDEVEDEIYASRHRDVTSVACVEDKCYVMTLNEYCRYKKFVHMVDEGVTPAFSIVPEHPEGYDRAKFLPTCRVAPDRVFLCRRVYESRQRRLLKNPCTK